MARVFIGVDPHKLSATIEVIDDRENLLATGRCATDKAGYAAMRRHVASWPDRVWAVEGSNGAGRPLAQRLLADGEHVVDVPAKLSARVRLFDTGHNRKTDADDAHAVAVVAVRTTGLRVLAHDDELEVLRMLVDRREELARQRIQTVNRLHRLLSELTPGKAKKDLTALQAKAILARALLLRAGQSPLEPRTGTVPDGNADRKRATPADGGQPHGERPAEHLDRVWPDAGPEAIVSSSRNCSTRMIIRSPAQASQKTHC
jgi:transposase